MEALREWLASAVLGPLAAALASAAADVAASAAAAGLAGVALAPLTSPGPASDDDRASAAALSARLAARAAEVCPGGHPAAPGSPPGMALLMAALARYVRLADLTAGDWPRGLLPPCPRGYVARRVGELAAGPCIGAFAWAGGGAMPGGGGEGGGGATTTGPGAAKQHQAGGGPPPSAHWTPELPTDSALLFHIIAGFLAHPGWDFGYVLPPPTGAGGGSSAAAAAAAAGGGPSLYVGGTLPSRPARAYHALLATRPGAPPGPGGAALVGLGLGTASPAFALVLGGRRSPASLGLGGGRSDSPRAGGQASPDAVGVASAAAPSPPPPPVTVGGPSGLLTTLLLFLAAARADAEAVAGAAQAPASAATPSRPVGTVGGRSLDLLGVGPALDAAQGRRAEGEVGGGGGGWFARWRAF